ncbi:hypothetical protein BDZ89DRAFT_1156334 [Hymenopellis radicata]|nr:hypothetical protein BDZ89DRAFT_1156334 [Hymenopellis radicata]
MRKSMSCQRNRTISCRSRPQDAHGLEDKLDHGALMPLENVKTTSIRLADSDIAMSQNRVLSLVIEHGVPGTNIPVLEETNVKLSQSRRDRSGQKTHHILLPDSNPRGACTVLSFISLQKRIRFQFDGIANRRLAEAGQNKLMAAPEIRRAKTECIFGINAVLEFGISRRTGVDLDVLSGQSWKKKQENTHFELFQTVVRRGSASTSFADSFRNPSSSLCSGTEESCSRRAAQKEENNMMADQVRVLGATARTVAIPATNAAIKFGVLRRTDEDLDLDFRQLQKLKTHQTNMYQRPRLSISTSSIVIPAGKIGNRASYAVGASWNEDPSKAAKPELIHARQQQVVSMTSQTVGFGFPRIDARAVAKNSPPGEERRIRSHSKVVAKSKRRSTATALKETIYFCEVVLLALFAEFQFEDVDAFIPVQEVKEMNIYCDFKQAFSFSSPERGHYQRRAPTSRNEGVGGQYEEDRRRISTFITLVHPAKYPSIEASSLSVTNRLHNPGGRVTFWATSRELYTTQTLESIEGSVRCQRSRTTSYLSRPEGRQSVHSRRRRFGDYNATAAVRKARIQVQGKALGMTATIVLADEPSALVGLADVSGIVKDLCWSRWWGQNLRQQRIPADTYQGLDSIVNREHSLLVGMPDSGYLHRILREDSGHDKRRKETLKMVQSLESESCGVDMGSAMRNWCRGEKEHNVDFAALAPWSFCSAQYYATSQVTNDAKRAVLEARTMPILTTNAVLISFLYRASEGLDGQSRQFCKFKTQRGNTPRLPLTDSMSHDRSTISSLVAFRQRVQFRFDGISTGESFGNWARYAVGVNSKEDALELATLKAPKTDARAVVRKVTSREREMVLQTAKIRIEDVQVGLVPSNRRAPECAPERIPGRADWRKAKPHRNRERTAHTIMWRLRRERPAQPQRGLVRAAGYGLHCHRQMPISDENHSHLGFLHRVRSSDFDNTSVGGLCKALFVILTLPEIPKV